MARTALPAGVAAASEQAIRQLAFRDFLRKHHGIAEQHKHQAAEDRRQKPAAYGRLKNELVQRHESSRRQHGWPQEKTHESGPDGRIHISSPLSMQF
ncbi:hypothetical protein P5G64_24825 [Serratia nevei]|uniref:hypothetical protein n=1 Tax=Serratia marcescens TaxID=615 RepID=UPI0023FA1FBC|nr:hypothetical protein [Serratia marcescens]MDF8340615.1 hypothetical protein [Serratia nevei]MDF8346739.1 hypothetical protein [Serratia nevei]MDF8351628.1 hypothetical protein [Serratia nevei]